LVALERASTWLQLVLMARFGGIESVPVELVNVRGSKSRGGDHARLSVKSREIYALEGRKLRPKSGAAAPLFADRGRS